MKKMLSVLICALLLFSAFTVSAFAETNTTAEETTEFVLEIDVNKRYTDIAEDTDGYFSVDDKDKDTNKTVYIAVLVAALVVSIVILAVSLKRVPKEEDIDISGQNKTKKDKEE